MNLFDIVGINQDDRGENLIVLTPSDHMLVPDFPGLPEDGCTITFERDVALSREDAQFITWEHPLIINGLDLILRRYRQQHHFPAEEQGAAGRYPAAGADLRCRSAGAETAAA
jgi:SNF2 family DNA or RNA helicase